VETSPPVSILVGTPGKPSKPENLASRKTWQAGKPGKPENLASRKTWQAGKPGKPENLASRKTWQAHRLTTSVPL
jgi:hypothetical protein